MKRARSWVGVALGAALLTGGCTESGDASGDASPGGGDADAVAPGDPDGGDEPDAAGPDPEALRAARLLAYCGSDWESVEARIDEALAEMTLEEKASQTAGTELFAANGIYPTPGVPRLGIPGLRMMDGPRGVTQYAGTATAFPVAMARAATWSPALEREVGEAIATEVRAYGANVLLAPTINLLRHPRWGRAQETYGEDPVLLGAMGRAFVEGAQSRDVLASAKHLALNSIEDTRFDVDVLADARTVHEIYLPHFREVVIEGRVASVMSAYNLVNGAYCAENAPLLTDILKDGWGFSGFVESDWILGTRSTAPSALAGLDIEMSQAVYFGPALGAAVAAGEVPEAVLDGIVRRIVRAQLCYRLDSHPAELDPSAVETPAHRALAREVATRGAVLLRNEDGALPLDPASIQRVLVTGPLADEPVIGDLGSSAVRPSEVVTLLEGLRAALGDERVDYVPGFPDVAGAGELAAQADAVIVAVGLTAAEEGEGFIAAGDRPHLELPPGHAAQVLAAAQAHPRTVAVLYAGAALRLEEFIEDVPAALFAWYPGMEGGHALADLLLGARAPSGRLPHVFPRAEADLPPFDNESLQVTYDRWHGYRYQHREGLAPRYPFGYGLTYTSFTYDALRLTAAGEEVQSRPASAGALAEFGAPARPLLDVEVTVTNSGPRDGVEVVQIYVSAPGSAYDRAEVVLAAFEAVALEAGETRTVTVPLPVAPLAVWSEAANALVLEPTDYAVHAGPNADELPLSAPLTVTAP